jgi:hypothetical protein
MYERRTGAIFNNIQYKTGVKAGCDKLVEANVEPNRRFRRSMAAAPAATRFLRFAARAALTCLVCAAAAQSGPRIEPRQAGQPPTESDKQNVYEMLDQLRAAVRNDDWAEAQRIASRLDISLNWAARKHDQGSPDRELSHVELMAGKDATTRTPLLPRLAKAAFDAQQSAKAAAYASEALEAARHGTFWWTGDAVHQGNIVLGRLALERGDIQAAEGFLLAAGKAPQSSFLTVFGPNMGLARDLLARGRRDAVVQYLEECRGLWTTDRGKLPEWLALVRAGLQPDFGPNVDY